MSEHNSSQVCMECSFVLETSLKGLDYIRDFRKTKKEEIIKELMAPRKFLFMTFTRTREEAENLFLRNVFDTFAPGHLQCFVAYFYKKDDENSLYSLIKACEVSCDERIWLSLSDAELIYNYNKRTTQKKG